MGKKRDTGRALGYYTGVFLLLLGVLVFFHTINGSTFIYNVDAPVQDYPTFLYMGKLLRHFFSTGKIRLYDFSIGLGGDVISTLNSNGIGDPLNLLSVFAVGRAAVYLYEFTIFLRLYICGISMLLFCRKHRQDENLSALAAVLYVFSAYALPYGLQYYQILNAAYIFPLLLIQLEDLIGQDKMGRGGIKFSFLIALQACCSFYFLYIQTILIFVYALVEYFIKYPKNFKGLWKKVFCVLGYYCVGILLSGIILFPVIGGFLNSARMEKGIGGKIYLLWSLEEILLKLENLFIHKRSAMYAVSPGISFLAFLGIIRCWFGHNQKERIMSVLLTIAYVSPFVWSMLNGFSYPGTRWVYVLFFGIAYAAVLLIEHCGEKIGKGRMAAAIAVFACSMGYHYIVQRDKIRTVFCVLLTGLTVWALYRDREKRKRNLITLSLIIILLNVILLDGPYQICGQELYLACKPRSQMEAIAQTVEEIQPMGEWNRIDKREIANQGALLQGYQGTWAYYSIMNGNIWKFYDALKITPAMQSVNRLSGLDGRQVLESLMSVKYYEEGGELKQNRYELPLGVEYMATFNEEAFWRLSPLERQDVMVSSLVMEGQGEGREKTLRNSLTELNCEETYENVIAKENSWIAQQNAKITVHIKSDLSVFDLDEGELYLYLKGIEVTSTKGEGGELKVANKTLAIHNADEIYTTGQRDQMVKIENPGQDIVLELKDDTAYHIDEVSVYWYALKEPREALAVLGQRTLTNLEYTDDCLEGDIDAAGGYLFLSIPYDKAWKVYVDQVKVPTKRANVGFTAVKLSEGKHHVRIVFEPLLERVGLAATVMGILLSVMLLLRDRRQCKLRKTYTAN